MSAARSAKLTILEVGTSKQLLFDDALTESKEGFVTTMNPAVRTEKPVLLPEKTWEANFLVARVSVMMDGGMYKMWYQARGEDRRRRTCYATSRDGTNWVRPSLGQIEYQGGKENNIVFRGTPDLDTIDLSKLPGRDAFNPGTVFKDPNAEPEKRFKCIDGIRRPPKEPVYVIHQVTGAYSPDGIHWTPCEKEPIMPWYTDTMNVCFWDDRIQKYVAYVRINKYTGNVQYAGKGRFKIDGIEVRRDYEGLQTPQLREGLGKRFEARAIGRSESEDFEDFPAPEMIMEPDDQDPPDTDLYNTAAVKYPYAADSYFMFPSVFHHKHDTLDVQLATSRDGVHFARWRDPFLRLGREDAFDSMQIFMGAGMLPVGDELWMYYGGGPRGHDGKFSRAGKAGIGRVRIRLDGFVSQDAPRSGGSLVTVPLRFAGKHLEVNMDGSASGWLKVEILDENEKPIRGFSKQEADELWGNNVRKPVTWKGGSNLSKLNQQKVRLHFVGQSVKLYAFQFQS